MDGRKVRGIIRDRGNPGNRATVKFVCEFLTPATGLGDVLAERLRQAGMTVSLNL